MRRMLLPVALAAVLLTACGDDARTGNAGAPVGTDATQPSATAAPVSTASPEQAATAPEALQFSAPLVGGGELDLRSYAGQTVAFWFWAPT
ncbi:MAG: hypothetical protein RL238_1267 [Actinomycetota bacterium]|jgi:hypothetical protein